MPQHNEESQLPAQPVTPADRDVRLLNAFLATFAVAMANDISGEAEDASPEEEEDLSPELVGVAFELMGVAGCATGCTEPGCSRTARINVWIAEAVAHVDGGEVLPAQKDFDDFMEELLADDPEDSEPPALLN